MNSFAAARNESIRHAAGDWIFYLDADDRIDKENQSKLRGLFARLGEENAAYVVKIRSKADPLGKSVRLLDQVRLFRNLPAIRWEYRIHEQIMPAITRSGGLTRWTDIIIDHTGYQDLALRRRKLERNLQLLLLEQKEQPDDPFTLFNLGRTYRDLDNLAECMPLFRRSLELSSPTLSIVRKLFALLASGYQELGQFAEAEKSYQEGLKRYPDDPELLFQQGLLLRKKGDLSGAENCFRRTLQAPPSVFFDMVEIGVRGHKAQHQLALLHQARGHFAEAEALWHLALAERPDYGPALAGLGDIFLEQRKWKDLEKIAEQFEETSKKAGEPPVNAFLLRARARIRLKEYVQARRLLEKCCHLAPNVLPARVLLSQALLEEGRDWTAAKNALQEILYIDPKNKDALHNLAILEKRKLVLDVPSDAGESSENKKPV